MRALNSFHIYPLARLGSLGIVAIPALRLGGALRLGAIAFRLGAIAFRLGAIAFRFPGHMHLLPFFIGQ